MEMDLPALKALIGEIQPERSGHDIWVVAHRDELPASIIGEARRLADDLGAQVHVIGRESWAQAAIAYGADRFLVANGLNQAESPLAQLEGLFRVEMPEVVLFAADEWSAEVAPRLAEALDTGLVMGCVALRLDGESRRVVATCPVYDGEYYLERASSVNPQLFTVQSNALNKPLADDSRSGEIIALSEAEIRPGGAQVLRREVDYLSPLIPLRKARRIIAVGRSGMKAESVEIAKKIARLLGAHFAGDRSAFDSGFIEHDQIIGVIGTEVTPQLYLAIGIWGDILHNAGIAGARKIIAIHRDRRAPIFQIADIGLVAEPGDVLPKLIQVL
jgi:electron transfer flavoprotein alpha subunit